MSSLGFYWCVAVVVLVSIVTDWASPPSSLSQSQVSGFSRCSSLCPPGEPAEHQQNQEEEQEVLLH